MENSNFYSGPQYIKYNNKQVSQEDISRLRQRMLNLEETVKELKAEIETLKNQ